jgi:hypothetical protein
MRGSAGALLDTGKDPTIAYGRGAAAAQALAAARAAPRTMDDRAQTRLLRCARNDANIGCHCEERSDEAISGVGGFIEGCAITTFSQTLTFVIGLLYLEKRVSYRRLRKEFGLDDETLEDVRHELIVMRLAVDEVPKQCGCHGVPGGYTKPAVGDSDHCACIFRAAGFVAPKRLPLASSIRPATG